MGGSNGKPCQPAVVQPVILLVKGIRLSVQRTSEPCPRCADRGSAGCLIFSMWNGLMAGKSNAKDGRHQWPTCTNCQRTLLCRLELSVDLGGDVSLRSIFIDIGLHFVKHSGHPSMTSENRTPS